MFEAHDLKTHNGTITVYNPETGNHRTFEVRTQGKDANFAPGRRVISLLVGPDNRYSYKGFGFVLDNGRIQLWKRTSTKTYRQLANIIENPQKFDGRLDYIFEGRCRKCNRRLTTPESIKSGIGPVCGQRI